MARPTGEKRFNPKLVEAGKALARQDIAASGAALDSGLRKSSEVLKDAEPSIPYSVRISAEERKLLRQFADAEEVSASELARRFIQAGLVSFQAKYAERSGEKQTKDFRKLILLFKAMELQLEELSSSQVVEVSPAEKKILHSKCSDIDIVGLMGR